MVRSNLRTTTLLVAFCLLPLVALSTPVAASHEDECAGGVDASDTNGDPTPLAVYAGCVGQFYNSPGSSDKHEDDFRDTYSVRVEGTGTAQIHWQLCNSAKQGILFYDVHWNSDLVPAKRVAAGALDVGQCTSDEPVVVKGDYRPGTWLIWLNTYEDYLPENKSQEYFMYVQPLWR